MADKRGSRAAGIVVRAASTEAVRSLSRKTGLARRSDDDTYGRVRRLRLTLEDPGPFYVKVGQILATRPDFVPDQVRAELSRLNDETTANRSRPTPRRSSRTSDLHGAGASARCVPKSPWDPLLLMWALRAFS